MSVVSDFGPVHKITCEEFQRMIEAGVFGGDDRLELLDGAIVEVSPMSPEHASVIRRLERYLHRVVGDSYWVNTQLPMIANGVSQPEPDVAVMRLMESERKHPSGADIMLAVEVALSSISIDRLKANLYAESNVREYWLVNVEKRCIEVHTEPRNGIYHLIRVVDQFSEIAPMFAIDSLIPVVRLLPPKA